jgi:hypothetical protein
MCKPDNRTDRARRTLLMMAMVALSVALGMTGAAAAAPPAETQLMQDLAKAVNDLDQATLRHDTATLSELVADDYMLVNSDTTLQDKQSYLADFKVPGFRIEAYKMTEPMQKVWSDAALTGGLLQLSWTQDGARHNRLLRIAHVWAVRDGRWRMTYTQLTRVPQ